MPGDFALTVTVRAARVKTVSATLNLGFDDSGEGVTWRRSANGRRLTATVPASRIFNPRLDKGYKLTIQATRKGGHALKRTVTFALCG